MSRKHAKEASSYLSVGDPYDKTRVVKDDSDHSSAAQGRFKTTVSKKGQLEGYFTKLQYIGEPFWDGEFKAKTGEKSEGGKSSAQAGFGSSAGNRRADLVHTTPTLRWKEQLEKEFAISQMQARRVEAIRNASQIADASYAPVHEAAAAAGREALVSLQREIARDPKYFQAHVPALYDIGRSADGTTPFCNKCSKSTFFCPHRANSGASVARRPTAVRTTYADLGAHSGITVTKPQFGLRGGLAGFASVAHLGQPSGDA